MGTLTFCRFTLRRGSRLLKRRKSPAPENLNNGHDGNGSRGNTGSSAPEPTDALLPETAFELAVLNDPPGATVDIVAVHGLFSDFTSWESDKGHRWLATLLAADFPTARIITFSYSSKPLGLPLQDAIRQGADSLLRSVRSLRLKTGEARRPVIFVSHSLGGLIVQRALVVAKDARDLASRDVYLATRGMMYFGVPGPCSGDDRLQGALADISRMMMVARCSRYAGSSHLDSFGDDAAALANGIRAFEVIGDRLHSVSASFCEMVPTSTPSGRLIIDQDCVARAAEIITLRRSHADLMRFDDKDDEGYAALRDWIAHIFDPLTFQHDPLAFQPDPRHVEGLVHAYNQVSFLKTDFDVHPKLPPVTKCHVRCNLLDTLHERFSTLSRRGRIPVVTLTGDPGVGKTFLARHFSDRISQTAHRSVFWLDATSRETLCASYLEVGRTICDYYYDKYSETLLGLHGGDEVGARAYLHNMLGVADVNELGSSLGHLDQVIVDASVKAVMDWLLYPENKWLLVLDNVGSRVDLLEFLPLALNGQILLLSQSREICNLPPGSLAVEIDPWSETEAYELFLAESGRSHDTTQEQAARAVVRHLKYRPSSIVHAASVIRRRDMTFIEFGADANAGEPALSGLDEHPRKDQMKEVMAVASVLSEAPLPLDLLISIENMVRTRLSGDSGVAWWRHSGAEIRRTRVVDSLKELGLLEQSSSDPRLFFTPVPVRAYFCAVQLRHAWLASSACVAALERQAHPASTPSEVYASGRLLLPHVLACHEWIARLADYEPSRPDPKRIDFSALGRLCAAQGHPSEAAAWFELALQRGEGLGAVERGEAMFSLAMLLHNDGERREELLRGISLCDDARDVGLEARMKLALAEGRLLERYGPSPHDYDDDDALSDLNHLAQNARYPPSTSIAALRALTRAHAAASAAEAAAECHGAIAAEYRSLLGPAHPAALDEEEARALALAETVRGPAAAVAALRTCVAIRCAAGGGPHPSVAAAQFRLAVLLEGEGREREEADGWFDAALTGMEGMMGEYHPGYLDAKEELGVCFRGRAERKGWVGGGSGSEGAGGEEMGFAEDIFRDVASSREEIGMEARGTKERLAEVGG